MTTCEKCGSGRIRITNTDLKAICNILALLLLAFSIKSFNDSFSTSVTSFGVSVTLFLFGKYWHTTTYLCEACSHRKRHMEI